MSRSRSHLWLAVAALGLVLATACGGAARRGAQAASEAERRAYHAARVQVASDPAGAERGFEAFLEQFPDSPLAPSAAARLGTLARDRGDTDEARVRYRRALARYPDSEISDGLRVRVADLELAAGNPGDAVKVLDRARLSRLPDDEKVTAYRILATAVEDPVAKLRWLARLRAVEADPSAVVATDADIDALIDTLDEPDLDRAARQIGREIPAARIELRRATLAVQAGDWDGAEAALKRAEKLPQAPSTQAELARLGERIALRRHGGDLGVPLPSFAEVMEREAPSTAGARGTLGVVLPLTGPFAQFGEQSLKGIELAAEVFGARAGPLPAPEIRLLVRDSGGRPERAAAAVRELAADPSVVAVVGPLLKGECEAAAVAAEASGLPLIALTARSEVAQGRSHVFRVRTQPEQEIQTLVEYSMNELGAERFAILYPRDVYGRGLRALFWDAVEDRGGQITAVAAYDPNATDFAGPIRELAGYSLLGPAEKAALAQREEMRDRAKRLPAEEAMALREAARELTTEDGVPLPPIVDFDALFIPESHEKVILIAPQLAFHEVVGARLLGASGWYSPDLVTIGRHHVADAVFTADYYPDSPMPFVREFVERFRSAFHTDPDAVAAQAFDAANLALLQLAARRDSREELREGLLAIRVYPGVSGLLGMSSDGNAHKRPFLLGVVHGKIKQIN